MLRPKPLSVYDQHLKHSLGYLNPYTLKQAISLCPKLYLASSLGNSEIPLNVRDNEDTLDDVSKSKQKVKEKMNDPIVVVNKQNCWTVDYQPINALYKDFVPQKELSAEQKYFQLLLFLLPRILMKLLLSRHQCRRDKYMQKNLDLIAKYFKHIYKPTNNNLRTSSNSRNKNVDTNPWYKNGNRSGQFGNQRTVNVDGARENIGSPVVQQSGIQCFNFKEFGHFAKECRKLKRVKDSAYHNEKMLLCKQAEQGVPLQAEQYDWLADIDEEIDEHELEAHYSYMAKIQEVPTADSSTDYEPWEQDDSNVILDSPNMCEDGIHNDQNDVASDDEHVALANLIANLKLDVDENKMIQKKLKKANTTLAQELKECKTILAETSNALRESISVWNSCLVTLQTKQTKFEKYKAFNDRTIDYDKLKQIVDNAWIKHLKDQLRAPTTQDMEILIQTFLMPLVIKTQNDSFIFFHELKQEMHVDLKYVESLKKEIDELESDKAEFSNMYDMILLEFKECDCLAQKLSNQTKFVSKEVHSELLKHFAKVEKHSISLEIALQKCKEQVKNDTVWNEKASNVFRKEREQYVKIQDSKAQLQDKKIAISELKKLIEKGKGKYVDTKPSVVQQPNAQRLLKPSVLGVNHKTNVSRTQHRSNQLKDKVVLKNSQVKLKKTQVEVHPKIPSVSNKMKSVTTCKDSLNSKTLNANAVYASCNKCLVDSNHFTCVTKMLNDVNAGTKKPNVVPISNLKLLCNFVEKFLGTVLFGNDQFVLILGYGDLVQGNITINRVYYIKGLNHNLFSDGQFCDADLEVAFRKSTCFIRDIQDVVIGLPKLKYVKDQLCSSLDAHLPSQQELDLLFGPLYDEFFNAEEDHLPEDEFTNPLCAPHKKLLSLPHTTLEELHQFDRLQNCTAMSSAEAEYVALSASYAQVMWMMIQLHDYGFNYNKIPLYCDSQTEYQLADMFTKAIPEDRFKYLVRRIVKIEILLEPTSNKLLVGLDDGVAASFQLESDSSPHAHAQTIKTY
nr:copia protein [Tanacetum cinerariifolium]